MVPVACPLCTGLQAPVSLAGRHSRRQISPPSLFPSLFIVEGEKWRGGKYPLTDAGIIHLDGRRRMGSAGSWPMANSFGIAEQQEATTRRGRRHG